MPRSILVVDDERAIALALAVVLAEEGYAARSAFDGLDALLLPGGVINPGSLRIDPNAVAFAKAFFDAGKPVAAICHGPWTVIETGAARGRRLTSWPSLKTDLRNAGADWVDQEAVVDKGLVTSRDPNDIPAFNLETIKLFSRAEQQAKGLIHEY